MINCNLKMLSIPSFKLLILMSSLLHGGIDCQLPNPILISEVAQEYCLPKTRVIIGNAYRMKINQNQENIITFFNQNRCYSNITHVTKDDFPVIANDAVSIPGSPGYYLKYPKCYWDRSLYLYEYKDYDFNKTTGTFWKGNRLIGFNNVWLGCPQFMCLSGGIDVIYHKYDGSKLIFRGRHVYTLGHPFGTSRAFTSIVYLRGIRYNMPVGYYDASIRNTHGLALLIKNLSVWWAFKDREFKPNTETGIFAHSIFDEKFPPNVDTVFYQQLNSQERIYYFKDGYYSIARYSDELVDEAKNEFVAIKKIKTFYGPKSVKELNEHFPEKIDAIDIDESYFYVYSGWKYYRVMVKDKWFHEAWVDTIITSKWVFRDRFKCRSDIYQQLGFSGYKDFIENFAKYSDPLIRTTTHQISPSTLQTIDRYDEQTQSTQTARSLDSNVYSLVLILIVLCVLVAFMIAVVVIFVTKIQPKNQRKDDFSLKVDSRFGQIDSETDITMNVSEISLASHASNDNTRQVSGYFEPNVTDLRKPIPIKRKIDNQNK